MATDTTAPSTALLDDRCVTFDLRPGALRSFLDARDDGGPRLLCYEGSVTLVSPGLPHEAHAQRLAGLILAVCLELDIRIASLGSTTQVLPTDLRGPLGETAYEPDAAYRIQSLGRDDNPPPPPDLAIEVVVSHPERKALLAAAALRIPELWILNVPRKRLTFYHPSPDGTYASHPRSLALPDLLADEVLEQILIPHPDDIAFHRAIVRWTRQTLLPRRPHS